ncbi:phage portal protein [Leifsonia aquatica]|uniref:phage portal protein n=1 Tax=Leifsonia aquatica TaxID=144185 RepID=UPI0038215AB1
MRFRDRIAASLGLAPLAADLAQEQAKTLERITAGDFEGAFGSTLHVGRSEAMRLPVVSKSRAATAGTIGRLPLYAQKGRTRVTAQPAILLQPEAGRPLSTTLTWTVDDLIFRPFAWWLVTARDSYNWPTTVKRVPWSKATFDPETGALLSAFGEAVKKASDVIQFDSWHGGLLHDGRDVLRRAIAIERTAALAEDNPVPTMELHNIGEDVTNPEDIDKILDRWIAARRIRGVAFTNKSIETKVHGVRLENLLISGRERSDLALVRAMNVPAWVADATISGQSLNYTNRQSRNAELIDLSLSPYMTVIRDRLSLPDVTPRGWVVKFDTDELVRPDLKTRFETYEIGKRAGFITNDQISEWEGWEAVAPEEGQPA